MNRDEVSAITHGDLPFANPLDRRRSTRTIATSSCAGRARARHRLRRRRAAARIKPRTRRHDDRHRAGARWAEPRASAASTSSTRMPSTTPCWRRAFDLVCIASSHAIGSWDEALRVRRLDEAGRRGARRRGLLAARADRGVPADALGGATATSCRRTTSCSPARATPAGRSRPRPSPRRGLGALRGDAHRQRRARAASTTTPTCARWVEAAKARWNHPDGRTRSGFTLRCVGIPAPPMPNPVLTKAIDRLAQREDLVASRRRGEVLAEIMARRGERDADRRVPHRAAHEGRDRRRAGRAWRGRCARWPRRSTTGRDDLLDTAGTGGGRHDVQRLDDRGAHRRGRRLRGGQARQPLGDRAVAARPTCSRRSAPGSTSRPTHVARCIERGGLRLHVRARPTTAPRASSSRSARSSRCARSSTSSAR